VRIALSDLVQPLGQVGEGEFAPEPTDSIAVPHSPLIMTGLLDCEGDAVARLRRKYALIPVGFGKEPLAAPDGFTDHADLLAELTARLTRQEVTGECDTVDTR
jgi:hypothetical protein